MYYKKGKIKKNKNQQIYENNDTHNIKILYYAKYNTYRKTSKF